LALDASSSEKYKEITVIDQGCGKDIMDLSNSVGEELRLAMRQWVTGVTVVCSQFGEIRHGMTVNSFSSVSLDPPHISITMANWTRTYRLTMQSNIFSVTVLSSRQQAVADRFAGRTRDNEDRFASLDTFYLVTGAPMIEGGLAHIDCKVVHTFPLKSSTLMVGEVVAAKHIDGLEPLIYFNRAYYGLGE
jgi:flavin reductase (DIM6/NTAB) family NADH-FMN oxidoreductase RutF